MRARKYFAPLVFVFGFLFGITGYFIAPPVVTFAAGFFYVDESGDVGIGNTSPEHRLDVTGAIYSRLYTLSDAGTVNVDWDNGNTQSLTLGGNRTITLNNGEPGGHYSLILEQDATGGRSVSWATSTVWQGDTPPNLSSQENAIDIIDFVYNGSVYLGSAKLGYGVTEPTSAFVDYLVVAGGGAGGRSSDGGNGTSGGGGGGAGGFVDGEAEIAVAAYTVTVGSGGTPVSNLEGGPGGNSAFDTFATAVGGGGGGSGRSGTTQTGSNGGSGGGGTNSQSAGSGTGGQGNNGATTSTGGGGGGCDSAASGATGGSGCSSSISGSSITYAAGGNGNDSNPGTAGGTNTGNGGAGNLYPNDNPGGNGGSGVVIISYPTGSITATGGSITTSGGNTIHTFTSSGTFTVTAL